MSTCKKCGLSIGWKRLKSGKWCPTNVDGTDHWDVCSRERRKDEVPYVSEGAITQPDEWVTHLYRGDIPVWELEGEFRDFSEIEKVELDHCYSINHEI